MGKTHTQEKVMALTMSIGDIRKSKEIPEEVKDLMVNLLSQFAVIEGQALGNIELAYRRGLHKGMGVATSKGPK